MLSFLWAVEDIFGDNYPDTNHSSPRPLGWVQMNVYYVGRAPTGSGLLVIISGDKTVSRNHCRITEYRRGVWRVEDNGSTGGTFMREGNGWRRIEAADVGLTDGIRLGQYVTSMAEILRLAEVADTPSDASVAGRASSSPSSDRQNSNMRAERHPETGEIIWRPR
jgi:FHA domain